MLSDYFISEKENYAEKMRTVVEPYLLANGATGYFKGWDGNNLFFEKHLVENAKGSIVVSHGFTECSEKFREMFWYFVNMGYNVFAVDHRGHGKSFRYNDDPNTVTIKHFDEYIKDLNCFVNDIVRPDSKDLPLYIYSHSMGGAIAVQYLQTYPGVFSKAVLSAPMIAPKTGNFSYPVAKAMTIVLKAIGRQDKMVPGYSDFNPKRTYENSHDTSKARFDYYQAKRVEDRTKQTASPSPAWVSEAIAVVAKNLSEERNRAIKVPVLLFQPAEDSSVISEKENEFIDMLENGQLVKIPDSKHEIYMAVDESLKMYLEKTESFLAE